MELKMKNPNDIPCFDKTVLILIGLKNKQEYIFGYYTENQGSPGNPYDQLGWMGYFPEEYHARSINEYAKKEIIGWFDLPIGVISD